MYKNYEFFKAYIKIYSFDCIAGFFTFFIFLDSFTFIMYIIDVIAIIILIIGFLVTYRGVIKIKFSFIFIFIIK
jgi:hypothetical protein